MDKSNIAALDAGLLHQGYNRYPKNLIKREDLLKMHAQLDFVRSSLRYASQLIAYRQRHANGNMSADTFFLDQNDLLDQLDHEDLHYNVIQQANREVLNDEALLLNGTLDEVAYEIILTRQAEAAQMKCHSPESPEPELSDSESASEEPDSERPLSPEHKVARAALEVKTEKLAQQVTPPREAQQELSMEDLAPCPKAITCSPS
ncbi:hypothetical protein MN608_02530 [Microdochium nivale]|nr:hypothetical protein MN608_02530 [Microdochium nivale]